MFNYAALFLIIALSVVLFWMTLSGMVPAVTAIGAGWILVGMGVLMNWSK